MARGLGCVLCKRKPDGGEQGDFGDEEDFGMT
jgi:hypothetical protein